MTQRGGQFKPTALKMIEGNRSRTPLNKNEPKPRRGELPMPPEFMNDDARLEWERIAPEVYHLGLLTVADVQTLAAYCQAFGRWMQAERALAKMKDQPTNGLMMRTTSGNWIQNPLVGTANKAARDMMRYASEFGLTPAARARLDGIGIETRQSKFDGFLQA